MNELIKRELMTGLCYIAFAAISSIIAFIYWISPDPVGGEPYDINISAAWRAYFPVARDSVMAFSVLTIGKIGVSVWRGRSNQKV